MILTSWAIETEGLSLKVGYRYLLKDINWQVGRGENWMVFGANGSGKTTLLSILAGFRQPTEGRAVVLGESYGEENSLALRRRIGWVSSSFFDQHYTREAVLDIVLSGKFGTVGLDYGIDDEDVCRAAELLRRLQLSDKIHQPFHLLSKGERQNVLIARALFNEPEILMLDEPLSGLDILARERQLAMIAELARDAERSVIYVTHHTEEIVTDVFARTLFLKDGLCYQTGATEELFAPECFSAFLGYPVAVSRRRPYGLETTPLADAGVKEGGQ